MERIADIDKMNPLELKCEANRIRLKIAEMANEMSSRVMQINELQDEYGDLLRANEWEMARLNHVTRRQAKHED